MFRISCGRLSRSRGRRNFMCVDHAMSCFCGKTGASFNFKDDILPVEAVNALYCPACSPSVRFNPDTMLADNGWIIEYDMDIARFATSKLTGSDVIIPEYIFDEGYCTWRGIYPKDHIDSARERQELLSLWKIDKKRYFEEMRTWSTRRMERLAREGWRKAREPEHTCA